MADFIENNNNLQYQKFYKFVRAQNFPDHLIKEFWNALMHTPQRFIVIDNGGSMNAPDGTIMEITSKGVTRIKAPKFDEARRVVEWQLELCEHAHIKTYFIFTVGNAPILVDPDVPESFARVRDILNSPAAGNSDYEGAFDFIEDVIKQNDEYNKSNNLKAAVIVVSDGQNLKIHPSFERVKVYNTQMVMRVTTDRWAVLRGWNNLDTNKHINIDVLDNVFEEAKQVNKINPWLTYSVQLHHLRESAVPIHGLDFLDEDKFTGSDIRSFIGKIYGNVDKIPYPEAGGAEFMFYVDNIDQLKVYDPIDNYRNDWIKVHVFRNNYRSIFGVNM